MSKYELTFRRTKGSPVTSDEIDQNFRNIKIGHDDHEKRVSSLEQINLDFATNEKLNFEVERLDSRIDNINEYTDIDVQNYLTEKNYVDEKFLEDNYGEHTAEKRTIAFNNRFSTKTTDDLSEGTSNLYFTAERAQDAVADTLVAGSNISLVYDDTTNKITISATGELGHDLSKNTTSDLAEGTNLYYTDLRARASISASGSLSYNSTTGVISYTQPTNVSTFTNDSGYITDYTVTESDVTAHQSALSITESQILDLKDYLLDSDLDPIRVRLSNAENRISVLEGNPVAPPIPYITVSALSNEANETDDRRITFIVQSRNFKDTDIISYSISGTNITSADVVTPLSGQVHTGNRQTSFNVDVVRDTATETVSEDLIFSVNSNSDNEFFSAPEPVTVRIFDTSFDSLLRTVSYQSGDWYTFIKNNVSSAWITNFDISSLRMDESDKAALTDLVNTNVSRAGMASLGFTNSQISEYLSFVLQMYIEVSNLGLDASFPAGTDTVIYDEYKLSLIGNDVGLRITGNDSLHPELNRPQIIDNNTGKIYIRNGITNSNVSYIQTLTPDERQSVIDLTTNALGELWTQAPQELKDYILGVTDVCIDYTSTLVFTLDLYNYEILQQNP